MTNQLFPHVPWVQPSILEADVFLACCGCGWSSELRDSEDHARLSAWGHLDDVRRWVIEQEADFKKERT